MECSHEKKGCSLGINRAIFLKPCRPGPQESEAPSWEFYLKGPFYITPKVLEMIRVGERRKFHTEMSWNEFRFLQ